MTAHCLMNLQTRVALIQNKPITPAVLVDAANACRCKECNEALERYAHIMLRQKFGRADGAGEIK